MLALGSLISVSDWCDCLYVFSEVMKVDLIRFLVLHFPHQGSILLPVMTTKHWSFGM